MSDPITPEVTPEELGESPKELSSDSGVSSSDRPEEERRAATNAVTERTALGLEGVKGDLGEPGKTGHEIDPVAKFEVDPKSPVTPKKGAEKKDEEPEGKKGLVASTWEKTPTWLKTTLGIATGLTLFKWAFGKRQPAEGVETELQTEGSSRFGAMVKWGLTITGVAFVINWFKKRAEAKEGIGEIKEEPKKRVTVLGAREKSTSILSPEVAPPDVSSSPKVASEPVSREPPSGAEKTDESGEEEREKVTLDLINNGLENLLKVGEKKYQLTQILENKEQKTSETISLLSFVEGFSTRPDGSLAVITSAKMDNPHVKKYLEKLQSDVDCDGKWSIANAKLMAVKSILSSQPPPRALVLISAEQVRGILGQLKSGEDSTISVTANVEKVEGISPELLASVASFYPKYKIPGSFKGDLVFEEVT